MQKSQSDKTQVDYPAKIARNAIDAFDGDPMAAATCLSQYCKLETTFETITKMWKKTDRRRKYKGMYYSVMFEIFKETNISENSSFGEWIVLSNFKLT